MAVTESKGGRGSDDGPSKDFREVSGMDPAANWLLDDAREDYLPYPESQMVPFLLELDDDEAVRAFNALIPLRDKETGEEIGDGAVVIGFEHSNDRVRAGELLPVLASLGWFERLLDDSAESAAFRKAKKRIALSSPLEPSEGPPQPIDSFTDVLPLDVAPPVAWPKSTVVMAVIDDGVAFAHERFRTLANTTRLLTHWDMQGLLHECKPQVWEQDYAEINKLIHDATTDGRVDEDAVYVAARQMDFRKPRHKPLAYRLSHGTHVLDLAAGYDPCECVDDRPIVAAQFPSPVVARTAGDLLDFYICIGVRYARARAAKLAPGKPLVINISFGDLAGAHDGLGALDRFLDKIVADTNRITRIVLPAGNSQRSRCHATIDLSRGPVEFDWIVQPDDRTHSVVEIWLPPTVKPKNRVKLAVTLPDGRAYAVPNGSSTSEKIRHRGQKAGLVELTQRDDGRQMFRISIAPTARPQPHTGALAPAGAWSLRLEAEGRLAEPAHAWCQRDDSLFGYPQRGRQSYFDHVDFRRFDPRGFELYDDPATGPISPVTRTSLLSGIASGREVVVAGGYQTRDGRIAPYSAGGPNIPPEPAPRTKPDVLAPADESPIHFGVLAAGARSGARLAQDGTSVASPEVARHVANMVAGKLPGSTAGTRARVAAAAKDPKADDPPFRSGAGRLPRLDPPSVERVIPGG